MRKKHTKKITKILSFFTKKLFSQKKKFWPTNFFLHTKKLFQLEEKKNVEKFSSTHFFNKFVLSQNQLFHKKTFFTKIVFLCWKIFFTKKISSKKNFFTKKLFWIKKIFLLKIFTSKKLFSPTFKIFLFSYCLLHEYNAEWTWFLTLC